MYRAIIAGEFSRGGVRMCPRRLGHLLRLTDIELFGEHSDNGSQPLITHYLASDRLGSTLGRQI
jgi:hypothetical protein